MSVEMNEYERSLLSPEELASIEDDVSPEELAALKGLAGDDDEDVSDNVVVDKHDEHLEQAAEVVAATVIAKQESDQDESAPAIERESQEPFRAQYQADLPADYKDQLTALRGESKSLAKQLYEGNIGVDEYTDKLEEITSKREALLAVRTRFELSQDMGKQSAEQEWRYVVARFNAEAAASDGIDYSKDATKLRDMDMFLKALAADDANEKQSSEWFLSEAHKRVKAMHGMMTPTVKVENKTIPARKAPVEKLPPSLAHVAGSDGPGDIEDEFSGLDRLDGIDLETAIAKMTPAQRNRYLQVA